MFALHNSSVRVRLRAEQLEDRLTPSSMGATSDQPAEVRIESDDAFAFYPRAPLPTFSQAFAGYSGAGAVVVNADVSGDGVWDYVLMAGVNGHLKVFDGRTGEEALSFLAYAGYHGPVSVNVSVTGGAGPGDIVTAAGANGHVKVFDGRTGEEVHSYLAYAGHTGTINVVSVDVNRDGIPDVVTGAGVNGHIKEFDGRTGNEVESYFAYPGFVGGIGLGFEPSPDGSYDISTFAVGATHRKLFDGATGAEIRSFLDADMDGRPDSGA